MAALQKADIDEKEKKLADKKKAYFKQDPSAITATVVAGLDEETAGLEAYVAQKDSELTSKRQVLYTVIEGEIKGFIKKITVEKGYSGVIDISKEVYHDSKEEITKLVIKNLGVLID
jgi:Skp family chaperone for outer membrane proteins